MAIVNPYWFFSTLAQATAASIGFVIAFVASSYASSAERSRGEVNLFQDRIRRILNEHREPLRTTAEQIGSSVSDQDIRFIHVRIVKFKYEKPYLESREELSETVETELSQVVDEDNLELSKSWIYVVAVRHVLNNLLFENDPVRINEESIRNYSICCTIQLFRINPLPKTYTKTYISYATTDYFQNQIALRSTQSYESASFYLFLVS